MVMRVLWGIVSKRAAGEMEEVSAAMAAVSEPDREAMGWDREMSGRVSIFLCSKFQK